MFRLNDGGALFWYEIFCILSLEKAGDFFHMIGFPLAPKNAAVERLAQEFVLKLDEIYPQHFTPGVSGEPPAQVKQMFDQIYTMLSGELGTENAEQLVTWGNQLQVLYGLRYSLSIYHGLLVSLELGASTANFALPALPDEPLQWLISVIHQFRTESNEISFALDELEKSPKSAWESQVFAMLNYDTRPGEISLGLYDLLYTLISDLKTRSLLITIRNQLNRQEFEGFDSWVRSQPRWIKAKSLPSPLYHNLHDLKNLLEEM